MSRRGCCLGAAKTGSGAVGGALQFREFALVGRAPAVEPCPVEVEPLAPVARFVTQLLPFVPGRVCALDSGGMTFGFHQLGAAGGSGPKPCLDERGLVFAGAIFSSACPCRRNDACDFCSHCAAISVAALVCARP